MFCKLGYEHLSKITKHAPAPAVGSCFRLAGPSHCLGIKCSSRGMILLQQQRDDTFAEG